MRHFAPKTVSSAIALLAAMILSLWPLAAGADDLSSTAVASDQELAAMRGGFVTGDGLLVTFGIERAIYVNGVLDTASNFTVSRIDGVSGLQQPASALAAGDAVKVIQIGPAGSNIFSPGKITTNILPGSFTVIQNSLNNQVVNNITTINASVTNMNLFRNLNLTTSISEQVIHGLH
jgi:hypothetical protein